MSETHDPKHTTHNVRMHVCCPADYFSWVEFIVHALIDMKTETGVNWIMKMFELLYFYPVAKSIIELD